MKHIKFEGGRVSTESDLVDKIWVHGGFVKGDAGNRICEAVIVLSNGERKEFSTATDLLGILKEADDYIESLIKKEK
jgi:hypothetical protein